LEATSTTNARITKSISEISYAKAFVPALASMGFRLGLPVRDVQQRNSRRIYTRLCGA
jgi:hypothetical protein